MTILTFPLSPRRLPLQEAQRMERPVSYEQLMLYRLGLGRPWLDLLNHEDQARIVEQIVEGRR